MPKKLTQAQSEKLAEILGLSKKDQTVEAIIELGDEFGGGWFREDGDNPSMIWLRSDLRGRKQTTLPHTQTGALFGRAFIEALAKGNTLSETTPKLEKEIRETATKLLKLLEPNAIWDT